MKIVVLSRSMAFPQKWKIIFLFLSFIYFKKQGMLPSDWFFKKLIIQFFKGGGDILTPKVGVTPPTRLKLGKKSCSVLTNFKQLQKKHALSEQQSMFPEIFSIVGLIVIALSASKAERAKNPARLTLVHPTLLKKAFNAKHKRSQNSEIPCF